MLAESRSCRGIVPGRPTLQLHQQLDHGAAGHQQHPGTQQDAPACLRHRPLGSRHCQGKVWKERRPSRSRTSHQCRTCMRRGSCRWHWCWHRPPATTAAAAARRHTHDQPRPRGRRGIVTHPSRASATVCVYIACSPPAALE